MYGEKIIRELKQENPQLVEFIGSTKDEICIELNGIKLTDKEMKSVSDLKSPGTTLAVVQYPEIKSQNSDLILVLDGIQDPGNLGTIIRTADWFGVDTIICSEDTVSMTNPKVVQASMGSVFRVSVQYGELQDMIKQDRPVYGALLEGETLERKNLHTPCYLIIGSEGNGISNEIRELVDRPIRIPSFGQAESLNASIACGILLAEFKID